LKEETTVWEKLMGDILELTELSTVVGSDEKMSAELETRVAELETTYDHYETQMFLGGPYDKGPAIISIYGGAGGEDAEDWASILFRMYQRYTEEKGWKTVELHRHVNEHGGIKNATFQVQGKYAYGYLKGEQGVHRLVRISPFSAKDLRHTSFAYVEVLPEIKDDVTVELKPEDLEIDFTRSSGPGGQNVNKRETAVRITHTPTGIAVMVQTERSQAQNKEQAMSILRAKLFQIYQKTKKEELDKLKGGKISIEWGNQIRSYVFHPYKLVKDHRTGVETSQVDKVLDGELDEFINAELRM
jgi:peptide chain release factor 2